MKTNKLKKCIISNSENSINTINLSQVLSNSNLNDQFWNSLKETINMRRESETIKARIFTAKRILTPIIQELMKDTLKQIEIETSEKEGIERQSWKEIKEKEIKVLYNNVKVGDIWHDQKDMFTDGEEWAMKILREISRDFEQPFDEIREKIEMNSNGQSNKDIFFNEKLLPKLVTIHQHLGNIIERLNQRCRKKRVLNSDDSLNSLSNKKIDIDNFRSAYSRYLIPRKMNEQKINTCTISSFCLINQKVGYPTKKHSRIQLTEEHACSVINLENIERGTYSMGRKMLCDVAISYDALFEECKNVNGNKEIVIKCLDDLERVRSYLEAIRNNEECEKPKFCDVESCKNDRCLESEPHLHSNLHNVPLLLKLNKHAEDNECNNDPIIGIPTISETSPDVHILLNTKDRHAENKHVIENNNQTTKQRKNSNRVSRIPKLISKKPTDLEKSIKSRSMRITLENKESSRRKAANLLIFDPDDPCKSIIKMKEQKSEEANDSRSVVSKARYKLTYKKDLIMFLVICCIGGKCAVWFFNLKHLFSDFIRFYIARIYVFIINSKFMRSLIEDRKMISNLMPLEAKYYCFMYKRFWRSKLPKFNNNVCWDENMLQLLRSIFLTELYANNNSSYKNMIYEKGIFRQKDIRKYLPRTKTHFFVYFFQCFKENKPTESRQYSCQGRWNHSAMNSTVNPMWTIKRSKYYTVPQNKKNKEKHVANERIEKSNDQIEMKIVNSLANIGESHHEINLQLSEVSLHKAEFRKVEAGSDKMCQKNEIKRKVSFREDVDVSEPDVDKENQDSDLQTKIHDDYRPRKSNKVEYEKQDMLDEIKEMSIRIPNLLMTESLLRIGRDISRFDSKRSKRTTKKISPKSLTLTESARHVLEKLSKSFEEEKYKSISNDIVSNFYDETGNRTIEIRTSDGDFSHNLKNKNWSSLNPDLFGSEKIPNNEYDIEEKRIRSVFNEKGRTVSRFQETNVQADLGVSQYYDHRGKPIKHLYDSSGYEMNTVGRDLTSTIFNQEGRLAMNIYTKSGKRIDAVYDSQGRLLGRVSYSQLEPSLRTEQVRVANLNEDSLNKLFESEATSVKLEDKDIKQDDLSPKRFFDQEGNPLIGVYDKKGKPLKVTSSGEACELLPFLFDTKGKLQSKRYDSKGKKLKAVFGEDGKVISGMSIAWLNDLLDNSKSTIPKIKKKESFFKKISLHKPKKEKLRDIDKLYDSKGQIITSVLDSEGKALAVSPSGNAEKLLPYLFDKGGKFIKKRYDTSKRKLGYVYGKDGKKIRTISTTYLENIAAKLATDESKKEFGEKPINSSADKTDSGENSPAPGDITQNTESDQDLSYFEKVPDQLFDDKGNLLTEIADNNGKILESSSSGNAWKLLSRLFDEKGNFLEGRFDKQGKKLLAVYNKEGNILNDILSTAIKIAAEKASKRDECNDYKNELKDSGVKEVLVDQTERGECEENFKNDENFETKPKSNRSKPQKKRKIIGRKRKSSVLKLPNSLSQAPTPLENGTLELSTSNLNKKEKYEKKQLKPTSPITLKKSTTKKIDVPEINAKAGESIDKFYDENGIIITKLYDVEGRMLVEDTTGDVEKLAKYLFDEDGFFHDNVFDRKGKKITQIFDHKKRSVSRISIQSIISRANIPNKTNRKGKKLPGRVYDKNGSLVQEIYDKKGHPIIVTRHAKLHDLAPVIFDEKGVRRRIYNKSGFEIGPIYDYKGNNLKHMPYFEKPRLKQDCKGAWIFTKPGKPLRNFYDSDGTLIISLFNDYGQALCTVKKGVDNVDLLSKFFFDKEGNFIKDRFFNYRGQMIKRVYDSDGNIISSIRRTKSRKIAHHKSADGRNEKISCRSNIENAHRVNSEMTRQKQKGYHGKSEVRPVENIVRLSSNSDTMLNPEPPHLHCSLSTYSLRDNPVRNELGRQISTSPISSLINLSVKKFYDENGKLLTGVYNSRARLLGYSASGNARVLVPYLFDTNGNFISGRYNLSRKPLQHVYDFNGKLVDKISNLVMKSYKKINPQSKKTNKPQIHDEHGNVITSIYDHDGKKLLDVKDSWDEIENLLDENGKFKRNLFNSRGSILKLNENKKINRKKFARKLSLYEKRRDLLGKRYQKESKKSALNNFKDKILTVIFDNHNRICEKFSLSTDDKEIHNNKKKNIDNKVRRKLTKKFLYDNDSNAIKNIYDVRGKKIMKLYNSDGKVISELYSTSGTLIKNNLLACMFEENVFRPKVYNSEGTMITAIFANNKKLKKVFDEKGDPAKVESDLVYLVSQQSLPVDEAAPSSESTSKHANYFFEGSTYHFPEGQLQFSKIQNKQLIGQNYETEMNVAFNGFLTRTDYCTCENCQKKAKNRKTMVGFGGELLDRLSRFTIPLAKFLPRTLLRRETRQDSEEREDFDSLETLIDEAAQQSKEVGVNNDEYYGGCSRVSLLESDDTIPISRKLVEKTLRKCVHLNSSTDVVGKVSDMVLQHFANLILQEIEQKFYHKLDVLQCGRSSSIVFERDQEKDICIGTEHKFEDSIIGKHFSAQSADPPIAAKKHNYVFSTQSIKFHEYFGST